MIGRYVTRLVDAQAGWARPFGDFNHRWLTALFRPIRPVQDFLNGTWLGHPVHAALTDVPIGALTVALILDIVGQPVGADVALLLGVLSMLGAAVAGLADYTEIDGNARMRATVHATLMVVSLVLFAISLVIRAGNPTDRTVAFVAARHRLPRARGRRARRRRPRLPHRDPRQPPRLARRRREMGRARSRRPARHPRGRPDEAQGRDQRPRRGPQRRPDPRPPRAVRPRRRAARRGHARRRTRSSARGTARGSASPTATSPAAPRCTTSRPTRCAGPRRADGRHGEPPGDVASAWGVGDHRGLGSEARGTRFCWGEPSERALRGGFA